MVKSHIQSDWSSPQWLVSEFSFEWRFTGFVLFHFFLFFLSFFNSQNIDFSEQWKLHINHAVLLALAVNLKLNDLGHHLFPLGFLY